MAIHKILVAVDYSECSKAALAYAAELARELDASIEVVHVWDRPAFVTEPVMVRLPGGGSRSLVDMIRENAEEEMQSFVSKTKLPAGVKVTRRLISGNPTASVLEDLKQAPCDLLIVGTHGRTGFRHALLGSVAEKLVRLSPVPVLTVPGSQPADS